MKGFPLIALVSLFTLLSPLSVLSQSASEKLKEKNDSTAHQSVPSESKKLKERADSTIQNSVNEQKKHLSSQKDAMKSEAKKVSDVSKDQIRSVKTYISDSTLIEKPKTPDLKGAASERKDAWKSKAENAEYNSEDPKNATWKKLSADDLGNVPDLKSPSLKPLHAGKPGFQKPDLRKPEIQTLSVDDLKNGDTQEKVKNKLQTKVNPESDKVTKKLHKADSVRQVAYDTQNLVDSVMHLESTSKIFSEKYKKKIYDSLGLAKADSIFKVGQNLAAAAVSEDEFLRRLNTPLADKTKGFDSLAGLNQDMLLSKYGNSISQYQNKIPKDLSAIKLPDSILSQLAPLRSGVFDSKYVKAADSMRNVYLKSKNLKLDEDQISDEIKKSEIVKNSKFIDKVYFEGILQYKNDSTLKIVQFAPSMAYQFTSNFSFGAGPNVSIELQKKKIIGITGIRSYLKYQLMGQRAYLQVEDNIENIKFGPELTRKKNIHSVLVGAGGILGLWGKIGINYSILYRVNSPQTNVLHRSPWVFRIGLSSIKSVKNNK
jgi:hypothetical protein